MTPMHYSPFDKAPESLQAEDLHRLKNVREGWYVEYKRQVPPAKSIAKSLSAFANHYGGWLFYGIDEAKAEGGSCAGEFPGVPIEKLSELSNQIREAAKDSVHPSPHFEIHDIVGPNDAIGLPEDRAIIVVVIPEGTAPPYVHNDGRIYVRVGDSSDPKSETDRSRLDLLWEKGKERKRRLREFLSDTPKLSEEETSAPYLHLFFLVDPYGQCGNSVSVSVEEFAEVVNAPSLKGMNFEYDNVFPFSDGYFARQVGTNDPRRLMLTWRFHNNGTSVITVPLRPIDIIADANTYDHLSSFLDVCPEYCDRNTGLIDLNLLILLIMDSEQRQRLLMAQNNISGPLFFKAFLENVWRKTPYLDTEEFIADVKKYRYPVIQKDRIWIPSDIASQMIKLPEPELTNTAHGSVEIKSFGMVAIWKELSRAFGIVRATEDTSIMSIAGAAGRAVVLHSGTVKKDR